MDFEGLAQDVEDAQNNVDLSAGFSEPDKLVPECLIRIPDADFRDNTRDDVGFGSELLCSFLKKVAGGDERLVAIIELSKRIEHALSNPDALSYFVEATIRSDFGELMASEGGQEASAWNRDAAIQNMVATKDSFMSELDGLREKLQKNAKLYDEYLTLLHVSRKPVLRKEWDDIRPLGKGAFGLVVATKHREHGKIVAVKKIDQGQVNARGMFKEVIEEGQVLRILGQCPSPFCLYLLYAFSDEEAFYYVMPVATAGDLAYHVKIGVDGKPGLTVARSRFYTAELALAISHLHSLDIVYRDMKPANVLLDHHGHVLLSDFGLAYRLNKDGNAGSGRQLHGRAGTEGYWAPEVIDSAHKDEAKRTSYDHRCDWWGLGVCLYTFLRGRAPFSPRNMEKFGNTKLKSKNAGTKKWKIEAPDRTPSREAWPTEATDAILRMLERDQSQRLCSVEALSSLEFFSTLDFVLLANRKVEPPFVPEQGMLYIDQADALAPTDEGTRGDADEYTLSEEERKQLETVKNQICYVNEQEHQKVLAQVSMHVEANKSTFKKHKPYSSEGEKAGGSSACTVS